WRLQERAEGGLSVRAKRRAEELADDANLRLSPPQPQTEEVADDAVPAVPAHARRSPIPGRPAPRPPLPGRPARHRRKPGPTVCASRGARNADAFAPVRSDL